MNEEQKFGQAISDLAGVFTDPLIVSPGGWHDTLPGWIREQVTLERLLEEMKRHRGGEPTGTDAEACAYLYTRCLESSMDRDWADIYLHVAGKEIMAAKGTEVPKDIQVESLTKEQESDLRDLKDWIYRRRRDARQAHDRAERGNARKAAAASRPKQMAFAFP